MNKVAQYLQQHLNGEILTSTDALKYFSTDESILQLEPQLVVYPRSENDVRKTTRFTWQLSDKGRVVPLTARGMGTDQTGAALSSGIIMAMPAHLNKIIELDPKTGVVTAEAGITLDKLQQVLQTHGRFLPPVSTVNRTATLGGAVSNNDSGRASYKYGPMQQFVRGLRVVLANGELIETSRISKRELNKKLGLASFEGEIYRSLDKLIEESYESLEVLSRITDHSSAGYDISDVKQKDGSFDLTPLFAGAQGTLGIIIEATLDTLPYSPTSQLIVAGFAERSHAWQAINVINNFKSGPATADFIDESLLKQIETINAGVLKPLEGGVPAVLLFFEIDEESARSRKKIEKKLLNALNAAGAEVVMPKNEETEPWERLRDAASIFLTYSDGKKRALPVLDDAQIPLDKISAYFTEVEKLMETAQVPEYAVWGQAGAGLIHLAPLLDITSVGDRQKIFKLMDAYYSYICSTGGSISGEYGEGRLRGALNNVQFDQKSIEIFEKIKSIFDPFGALNPGVKVGVKTEVVKSMVRNEYSVDHQFNHLPRG